MISPFLQDFLLAIVSIERRDISRKDRSAKTQIVLIVEHIKNLYLDIKTPRGAFCHFGVFIFHKNDI